MLYRMCRRRSSRARPQARRQAGRSPEPTSEEGRCGPHRPQMGASWKSEDAGGEGPEAESSRPFVAGDRQARRGTRWRLRAVRRAPPSRTSSGKPPQQAPHRALSCRPQEGLGCRTPLSPLAFYFPEVTAGSESSPGPLASRIPPNVRCSSERCLRRPPAWQPRCASASSVLSPAATTRCQHGRCQQGQHPATRAGRSRRRTCGAGGRWTQQLAQRRRPETAEVLAPRYQEIFSGRKERQQRARLLGKQSPRAKPASGSLDFSAAEPSLTPEVVVELG